MLSDDELRKLLQAGEADHVERTISVNDTQKFGEAICAFANDLPDRRSTGVLLIGVDDKGRCGNVEVTEAVLQLLMGFRTDGTILPPPLMTVRRHAVDGCSLAVVEVEPSENPPLKFRGRVCVRIGPRRGYATAEEERRLTEKRRWANLPFDQQGIPGASIADLDLLRFREEYLPALVHPDVIAANERPIEQQLQALSLLTPEGQATALGLLTVGKDPRAWLPGAYVQFVRYPGTQIGEKVQDQKEIGGPLSELLRRLDEVINMNIAVAADLGGPTEEVSQDYPTLALQELIRNAVIHRNYEGTASPVMINWYSDRVEVTNPGGPFGTVTAEAFGQPGLTDARNPGLASAAKALGFVQRFGSGIPRAQNALAANGNPLAQFSVEPTYVNATVSSAT
jgi:ATP-dependent DNA helicase RecG